MFGGRSFGAPDSASAADLVDDWLARAEERAARTTTAHSSTGRVSVTVGASGAVTGLELAEDIRDQPAADTAREILTTLRAAQALLATEAGPGTGPAHAQSRRAG